MKQKSVRFIKYKSFILKYEILVMGGTKKPVRLTNKR